MRDEDQFPISNFQLDRIGAERFSNWKLEIENWKLSLSFYPADIDAFYEVFLSDDKGYQ